MEEKTKVFLDSNVIFSIAYSGREHSRSYLIYELQRLKILEVYISNLVSREAVFNIRNKRPDKLPFLNELIRKSKILADAISDAKINRINSLPLNDKMILTTAVFLGMDFFLTGNDRDFKDFYNKRIHKTLILKLLDFLRREF